ncbi:MAG: hypothetical protein AAF688_06735 [Bacteroidota bacterium]
MTEILKLAFCKVEVFQNYMVVIVDEGETIDMPKTQQLINLSKSLFPVKPFVYVTHRVNSYAVDPKVYEPTSKIKNLAGFCVVSLNFMAKTAAEIESLFIKKPFAIFDTMEEAENWIVKVISENK